MTYNLSAVLQVVDILSNLTFWTLRTLFLLVSSTFTDPESHRKAATEALERLGSQVDRMEVFSARPDDATHASLKDLEECELFVGI